MNMPPDIRIGPVTPEYLNQFMALMPHAADSPTRQDYYGAYAENTLVGCAALSTSQPAPPAPSKASFQVALADEAPVEAGDMLAQAMKVIARKQGCKHLGYLGGVPAGSETESMLMRCNFSAHGEPISRFCIDPNSNELDRYLRGFEAITKRRPPAENTLILPLNKIAAAAVDQLLQKTIGGVDPSVHREILNPATISIGIQQGSSLMGVHVVCLSEHQADSTSLTVAKGHRGSWLYTALIAHIIQVLRDKGVTEWTYKTNPGIHHGILNSSNISHARHIGTERMWAFPLS